MQGQGCSSQVWSTLFYTSISSCMYLVLWDFAEGIGSRTWGPSKLGSLWKLLLSMDKGWGHDRAQLKACVGLGTWSQTLFSLRKQISSWWFSEWSFFIPDLPRSSLHKPLACFLDLLLKPVGWALLFGRVLLTSVKPVFGFHKEGIISKVKHVLLSCVTLLIALLSSWQQQALSAWTSPVFFFFFFSHREYWGS